MNNGHSSLREFGRCRLDFEKKVLWANGETVQLPLKAVELLCLLVDSRGAVVTKEEIWHSVWNDSFVEETNLTHNIYVLRKTLKDLGEDQLIRTIPRRGYRFTGEVREIPVDDVIIERHALTRTTIEIEDSSANHTGIKRTRLALPLLAGATAVIAIVTALVWTFERPASRSPIRSLAVLPLKNVNAAQPNDHSGLGLADALITRLGNIKTLMVRPTSSITQFESAEGDTISIGQKLQVDSVLEGSMYRLNDRVRVNMRLLRVANGETIWSGEFERTAGDEFAIEKEISLKAADALALNLTTAEQNALGQDPTRNADAYDLYLKGRYAWNKRSWQGMDEAEKYFRAAIEKDPDFALAYVGLADRIVMETNADETQGLVGRALELDPNLAEAYATRGFYETFHRWRWAEAESDLENSIRLKPNYGTAHQWLGILMEIQGRNDEALAEMERAVATDPTSPNFLADLGQTYYLRREYDKAREYCRKALEIDPNFKFAHDYLLNISLVSGELKPAVDEWKFSAVSAEIFPNISEQQRKQIAERHAVLEARFKSGTWTDFVKGLIAKDTGPPSAGYGNGRFYALLGDRASALDELERGVDGNAFGVVFIKADPFFDSLKNEPRYQAILKRMNLPAE